MPRKIAICLFCPLLVISFLYPISDIKPGPVGIYCLMPGDMPDRRINYLGDVKSWEYEYVDGFTLRTSWDRIEAEEGKRDWSYIDQGVSLARKHNKKIGLSIRAGVNTPNWVYQSGARSFTYTLNYNYKTNTPSVRMPLIDDKVFHAKFKGFIDDLAARYDQDETVSYVMITGLGHEMETYYIKVKADMETFEKNGGWNAYQEGSDEILKIYTAFKRTPVHLGLAQITPDPKSWEILEGICAKGLAMFPRRFGLQNQGLTAAASDRFLPHKMVRDNTTVAPVGFQMVWETRGPNASLLKGTLREALDAGVKLKAHFIEVYAYDLDQEGFVNDFREIQKGLKENAKSFYK